MNHKLYKADCILVLGSNDIRVAERGAQLLLDGWADVLIFSGGLGRLTKGVWERPEANIFTEVALKMGVSEDKIIIENQSTNSGENILFTKKILDERGLNFNKFILVQKPHMERRAYATFQKQLPGKEVIVTSPQMDFEKYCHSEVSDDINTDEVINLMVGNLERVKYYPEKGFQIYQEIPNIVWQAYEQLVRLGYSKYSIGNS